MSFLLFRIVSSSKKVQQLYDKSITIVIYTSDSSFQFYGKTFLEIVRMFMWLLKRHVKIPGLRLSSDYFQSKLEIWKLTMLEDAFLNGSIW